MRAYAIWESSVLAHVTPPLLATWFEGAPVGPYAWVPPAPFQVADKVEVVPFQFEDRRYLTFFSDLASLFDGDTEFAATTAAQWANGFIPESEHRLVKFFRADANNREYLFNPNAWKLSNPRLIFEFGTVLVDTVLVHADSLPQVTQYLYMPAEPKLDRFYARAFKRHPSCPKDHFLPILGSADNDGVGCGYQRASIQSAGGSGQSGQCPDVCRPG